MSKVLLPSSASSLLLRVLVIIFVAEAVIIFLLSFFNVELDDFTMALVGGLLLSAVCGPLIYFRVVKPFVDRSSVALERLKNHEYALSNHTIFAETNVRGDILDVNELFCKISGYDRGELIGQNHRLLNSGHHSSAFWKDMYRTIANGDRWQNEVCNRAKDGSLYWVRTTITAVKNAEGKPVRYLALRTDITELVEQRERLVTAVENVQRLKLDQEKMFAVIAHELRTPAAAISMLADSPDIESDKSNLDLLRSNSQHLLAVMDDLRAIIKPDAQVFKVAARVDLEAMLMSITQSMKPIFDEWSVSVNLLVELADEDRVTLVNEQAFRQVVSNILKNAAIHSGGTAIWISLRCHKIDSVENCYTLSVEDNGSGVKPDKREKIFEPFERGDTTASGTGIGLSVSRDLARSQSGNLIYEEGKEGGSLFTYTFVGIVPKTRTASLPQARSGKPFADRRILLIEDDLTLRMVSEQMLKRAGAEVISVADGQAGVESFQSNDFDLVITDIMMPKLDGFGVVKTLRNQGFKGLIIGVSAATMGDELDQLVECGADAAIGKPLTVLKLAKRLEQLNSLEKQAN